MAQTLEKLRSDLSELPIKDRAEMARFLIESLAEGADEDAGAEWDIELRRRLACIEDGTAEIEPSEAVFARLREKYG